MRPRFTFPKRGINGNDNPTVIIDTLHHDNRRDTRSRFLIHSAHVKITTQKGVKMRAITVIAGKEFTCEVIRVECGVATLSVAGRKINVPSEKCSFIQSRENAWLGMGA